MSDEIMYDDEEMREMFGQEDELTPEEVLTMVTLNTDRKVKVQIELKDDQGDTVSLPSTIEGILEYIKSKVSDEDGNQFTDQILPLMSQSTVSGLGRMVGIRDAGFMLTQDKSRTAIIYMMCIAFLLLKFVQNNNLKIHTHEEPVTDEEIEDIKRKTEISKVISASDMMGVNPREILEYMKSAGKISEEDIENFFDKKEDLS